MIDLTFHLFWSGSKLSYLRYLTFASLRHFHPKARIRLCIADKCKKTGHTWLREKQDFESSKIKEDFLPKLRDLNVEIQKIELFSQYAPNFQSDFFRWWALREEGGFYLDTDQIILKPFDTLPLDHEMIYCKYVNPQCGMYTPVGVVGAEKGSPIVQEICKKISKYYNPNNYNSIGPFMFLDMTSKVSMDKCFKAPKEWFYPAWHSDMVKGLYDGTFEIPEESIALHWFGGHPLSQIFNNQYVSKLAKTAGDVISKKVRELGIG